MRFQPTRLASQPMTLARRASGSLLARVSLVHATNDACFSIVYPILPLISADLGLSYAQSGMVKTAFSGASSVLQIPVALLGARWGEYLMLLLGNAWVGFGLLGMALTGGFVLLLLAAVLAGIGGNAQHPLGTAIVSKAARPERIASEMGTLNFAGDLGKLAGPLVVGSLAVWFGWRVALATVGGVTALVSLLMLLAGPRREPAAAARGSARGAAPPADAATAATAADERTARGFGFVLLAGGLDNAARGAALTFLPFLLDQRGFSPAALSTVFALIFGAGAAGKFACGWMSDRWGPLAVIVTTELLTAASLLAVIVGPDWAGYLFALTLGFALNGTSSALNVSVTRFVPAARRGWGFGVYFTVALLASAIAPLAYGLLADATTVVTALAVTAGMTVLVIPAVGPVRGEIR